MRVCVRRASATSDGAMAACAVRCAHYFTARRRRVSVLNNRIARFPAFAPFVVMTAGAAIRCPGGCHLSRRVHRMEVTHRRQ